MFWIIDYLNGSIISKHYNEISFVLNDYHSEASKKIRSERLSDLILHASTSTEFYSKYQGVTDLIDLPVVNKNSIRNDFKNFKSNAITSNYKVITSGSTGTPFTVYLDKNKRKRNIADTIFFAKKAGFKLGSKLIFIRVWSKHNGKNRIKAWFQNVKKQEVREINKNAGGFIKYLLSTKSNKGILGHASALETLCHHIEDNNLEVSKCNLNSIIANSEQLNEQIKLKLEKQFGISVVSRYSNVENGIIAQQSRNGNHEFNINWASYFVEILKFDKDEPVKIGEVGRVVITDLFNYSTPMLRYDTGDIASMTLDQNKIPVFKTVEGRKLDVVYNTKGEIVPALLIGGKMKKYIGINQFQFIQEGKKDYMLKLNVDQTYKSEKRILKELRTIFGLDCRLTILYVNEIPPLYSGKRRYVVNNHLNKFNKSDEKSIGSAFH